METQSYWWPLATIAELDAGKPLARTLHGEPLVLFKGASGQPVVMQDRCPHRHAPLSCGHLHRGELSCPYHGWRFAEDGRCSKVPGMTGQPGGKPLVKVLASRAAYGLVWACSRPEAATPPPSGPAVIDHVDSFFMTDTVHCEMADAAENFLDGFHTHFVHAGWIRRDSQRQVVKARVRRLGDGIEASYSEEGLQSGLISRLLEGSRTESRGRFRLPGIAEIEYRGKRGLNLLVTAWLTPEVPGRLRIHARIATRRGLMPASLKRLLLRRLFGLILRQDKAILELTHANRLRFAQQDMTAPQLDTELDLLGPAIRRLLNGEPLDDSIDQEIRCHV